MSAGANHNGQPAAARLRAGDVPPPPGVDISTRERLSALLGERKRTVAGLSGLAVVSGLLESVIIGLIVQIAANAAKGTS